MDHYYNTIILREYLPKTPEDYLIWKEENQPYINTKNYVYDLLSCLTIRDIKILCLLGKIPVKDLDLDPKKIKYKTYPY